MSDFDFAIIGAGIAGASLAAELSARHKVCGGAAKVARVEMQQTATDVLIGAVTLGIYTPREMRITCVR